MAQEVKAVLDQLCQVDRRLQDLHDDIMLQQAQAVNILPKAAAVLSEREDRLVDVSCMLAHPTMEDKQRAEDAWSVQSGRVLHRDYVRVEQLQGHRFQVLQALAFCRSTAKRSNGASACAGPYNGHRARVSHEDGKAHVWQWQIIVPNSCSNYTLLHIVVGCLVQDRRCRHARQVEWLFGTLARCIMFDACSASLHVLPSCCYSFCVPGAHPV